MFGGGAVTFSQLDVVLNNKNGLRDGQMDGWVHSRMDTQINILNDAQIDR